MGSDDFAAHKSEMTGQAYHLVRSGRCTLDELRDQGGWMRSQNHTGAYFLYCGGENAAHRVYFFPSQ